MILGSYIIRHRLNGIVLIGIYEPTFVPYHRISEFELLKNSRYIKIKEL